MKNSEKFKTAKERAEAFDEWCGRRFGVGCETGETCGECQYAWLDLEAEKEKPLPCPFCGSNTNLFHAMDGRHAVHCLDIYRCKYMSGEYTSDEEAIAAHNLVARAVMEAEKKGAEE